MLQLTQMTVPGMMDMQYVYAAGANNGRITQSIDGIGGETVNYSYDKLNRLTAAGAANGTSGQAFTYDGFGNLTGKTATAGSPPTLSASFDPLTNRNGNQVFVIEYNLGEPKIVLRRQTRGSARITVSKSAVELVIGDIYAGDSPPRTESHRFELDPEGTKPR